MKKKIALLSLIATTVIGIMIFSSRDYNKTIPHDRIILTEHQLEPYLNLKGWEVVLIESEKVRIPMQFSGNFQKLVQESEKSDFNLSSHKGKEVTRYTYKVKNHTLPHVIAELLITAENELISAVLIEQTPYGFIKQL